MQAKHLRPVQLKCSNAMRNQSSNFPSHVVVAFDPHRPSIKPLLQGPRLLGCHTLDTPPISQIAEGPFFKTLFNVFYSYFINFQSRTQQLGTIVDLNNCISCNDLQIHTLFHSTVGKIIFSFSQDLGLGGAMRRPWEVSPTNHQA